MLRFRWYIIDSLPVEFNETFLPLRVLSEYPQRKVGGKTLKFDLTEHWRLLSSGYEKNHRIYGHMDYVRLMVAG
jgi:hypothetical protein